MNKYQQLKLVSLLSIVCFAVIAACLISAYFQLRGLGAELRQTRKMQATDRYESRLNAAKSELEEFKQNFAKVQEENTALQDSLSDKDKTIKAQLENLRHAAEQLRRLSPKQ